MRRKVPMSGVFITKKKGNMAPMRFSTKKQGTAPDRAAFETRGVQSDAHTPTTGKLMELLYAMPLMDDILANHKLKPPKPNPNVKCYSTPLETFVDPEDMDNVVMRMTKDMNNFLSKDKDVRLDYLDRMVEAFVITDPKHPAKRHHEKCHKWLGTRQVERGLRAKQELKKYAVLGEYCGVVKTSDAHERDTAAACPDDPTLGYLIRDKTEEFSNDLDLPDGHWAKGQQLIVDASKAGNCLSLINDARNFRPSKQSNVIFLQVHDLATGELHIFVVTTQRIKKGQEILLDYGESFWQQMSTKVVWAEKMAAKEEELQIAKRQNAALQANVKDLQSKEKKFAMLEADFKGAMKLRDSAEDQCQDAEERLNELKKENKRLQEEKQADAIAREGELKQVRADHSAALAHAASLQEQLSKSQAQVAEVSNGKQALQERLSSLRASYERQSFEVHHLERVQAVGLQAACAASQRMHQDILAAEAELRAKDREQAALVAACQEHERREADMARQVAMTRARLAAAESAEEAAESAKDALARNMRAREAEFAAELAAREAELNRERARRNTAVIASAPGSKPIGTGAVEGVPMESTKDIMACLERMGACLRATPPDACASGPALLAGLDRGMQVALVPAQRKLPTFAEYYIRDGLTSQEPLTTVQPNPISPGREIAQEPFVTAVRPYTAAVGPGSPTMPEPMPSQPKKEPSPQAPSHDRAVAGMRRELRKMHIGDTIIEEGELPAVSEQDSCGNTSRPTLHDSQLSDSSARRPRGNRGANQDRSRSRNRGGPGTRRMKLPGSFSLERGRGGGHGRGRSESAGRGRKRMRSDGSQDSHRSRSRCGVSERGRRIYTLHERPWRNDGGRGRGRSRERGSMRSFHPVPPEADRSSAPSNISASSHAVSPTEPMPYPKSGYSGAGIALNQAGRGIWSNGGNAAVSSDVRANNQVPMTGALPASSLNTNVLRLSFPATNRLFHATPQHMRKGNNKYCE